MSKLRGLVDKIIDDKIAAIPASTPAAQEADLDARILKVVEDALLAGLGTFPVIDDATLADLKAKISALETVNATQNTKIAALEATGVASTQAVFGVADTAWTKCTRAAGITRTIQVRIWKGRVIFQTNGGTIATPNLANPAVFTDIATLPASIPKPPAEFYSAVSTWQLPGTGYRYGAGVLHIRNTDGVMRVAPGHVSMDGFDLAELSYPVGAI